jgi:hypothetical protein
VTVSHYARTVRDARHTAIFSNSPDRWIIVNEGHAQTFRLPAALAARLDLARSPGVLGWKQESDQAYLHTDGSPVVTVTLAPIAPPAQPRLETISGPARIQRRDAATWAISVGTERPVDLVFAGITSDTTVRITGAGAPRDLAPDQGGRVPLTAPAGAEILVEFGRR